MTETGAVYAATLRRLLGKKKVLNWAEIARSDDLSAFQVEGQEGYPKLSAEAFVVWLLYRQEKPMNENLICKRLKENGVTYPRNVVEVIGTLCYHEALQWTYRKGYIVRPAMRDIIKDPDMKEPINESH